MTHHHEDFSRMRVVTKKNPGRAARAAKLSAPRLSVTLELEIVASSACPPAYVNRDAPEAMTINPWQPSNPREVDSIRAPPTMPQTEKRDEAKG